LFFEQVDLSVLADVFEQAYVRLGTKKNPSANKSNKPICFFKLFNSAKVFIIIYKIKLKTKNVPDTVNAAPIGLIAIRTFFN